MTIARSRLFLAALSAAVALCPGVGAQTPPSSPAAPQVLSLEDCLRVAMENNHRRPEGIGLQLRELFLGLDAAAKTYEAANRAMMTAQYVKARYDQLAIGSQISVVVGKEVAARVNPKP